MSDRFPVHGIANNYSLEYNNMVSSSIQDVLIKYQNDVIGVVQDVANLDSVNLNCDFSFISYPVNRDTV